MAYEDETLARAARRRRVSSSVSAPVPLATAQVRRWGRGTSSGRLDRYAGVANVVLYGLLSDMLGAATCFGTTRTPRVVRPEGSWRARCRGGLVLGQRTSRTTSRRGH